MLYCALLIACYSMLHAASSSSHSGPDNKVLQQVAHVPVIPEVSFMFGDSIQIYTPQKVFQIRGSNCLHIDKGPGTPKLMALPHISRLMTYLVDHGLIACDSQVLKLHKAVCYAKYMYNQKLAQPHDDVLSYALVPQKFMCQIDGRKEDITDVVNFFYSRYETECMLDGIDAECLPSTYTDEDSWSVQDMRAALVPVLAKLKQQLGPCENWLQNGITDWNKAEHDFNSALEAIERSSVTALEKLVALEKLFLPTERAHKGVGDTEHNTDRIDPGAKKTYHNLVWVNRLAQTFPLSILDAKLWVDKNGTFAICMDRDTQRYCAPNGALPYVFAKRVIATMNAIGRSLTFDDLTERDKKRFLFFNPDAYFELSKIGVLRDTKLAAFNAKVVLAQIGAQLVYNKMAPIIASSQVFTQKECKDMYRRLQLPIKTCRWYVPEPIKWITLLTMEQRNALARLCEQQSQRSSLELVSCCDTELPPVVDKLAPSYYMKLQKIYTDVRPPLHIVAELPINMADYVFRYFLSEEIVDMFWRFCFLTKEKQREYLDTVFPMMLTTWPALLKHFPPQDTTSPFNRQSVNAFLNVYRHIAYNELYTKDFLLNDWVELSNCLSQDFRNQLLETMYPMYKQCLQWEHEPDDYVRNHDQTKSGIITYIGNCAEQECFLMQQNVQSETIDELQLPVHMRPFLLLPSSMQEEILQALRQRQERIAQQYDIPLLRYIQPFLQIYFGV